MTSGAPPLPRAWLVVGLLWFVACFNYLARMMITTMHGSMLAAFPITEAEFGLLTSVFLWAYGLLSPFAGFLADRFSRSRVIVVSLCAWSAITWLTAFSRTFEQLLVMRALMGVCEACYIPASLALIADYHRGSTRALATGVHLTGFMIGAALGGLGGWLADLRSWNFAFSAVGIVGIGYGVVLMFTLRDAPRERPADVPEAGPESKVGFGQALGSLFRSGSFIAALAYWGVLGAGAWEVAGWLPTYLREHFNLTQGKSGFYAGGFVNVASFFGMLASGAWADRWTRTRVRGPMFAAAIMLCAVPPALLLMVHTNVLVVALVCLLVYGFAISIDSTMMPILCLITDPRYRATGYGLLNMMATLAGGGAIYAAGALRDVHFDLGRIMVIAAGCLAIAPLLLLVMVPRQQGTGAADGSGPKAG